jgi:hypothetical protein
MALLPSGYCHLKIFCSLPAREHSLLQPMCSAAVVRDLAIRIILFLAAAVLASDTD